MVWSSRSVARITATARAEFGGVGGAVVAGFRRLDLERAILDRETRPQQVAVGLDLVEGHGQAQFDFRQGEPARPRRNQRQESKTDHAANDEAQREIDDLLDHLSRPVTRLNGAEAPAAGRMLPFLPPQCKAADFSVVSQFEISSTAFL